MFGPSQILLEHIQNLPYKKSGTKFVVLNTTLNFLIKI